MYDLAWVISTKIHIYRDLTSCKKRDTYYIRKIYFHSVFMLKQIILIFIIPNKKY